MTAQLGELEGMAGDPALLSASRSEVSGWSVGQHADHLAMAGVFMTSAVKAALEEPPKDTHRRPILIGRVVLWTGFIPRGKGKAPGATQPQAVELPGHLRAFREALAGLEGRLEAIASSRGRVKHPALGWFSAAEWLRFLDIHRHHMKIVRDIERR